MMRFIGHYAQVLLAVTLLTLILFGKVLFATTEPELGVDQVIKKVEDNLNGKTAVMEMTMVVKTKRAERTMKMKSWSEGNKKSFIKILYPGKDKGITFLKLDNAMWQYVPRIEKTIKIPASMMLQSWMGSDFSNDDLVRESSISEDYTKKLLEETESEYRVELLPKPDAPVVWGKIIFAVSRQYFLPSTVQYFDEDGNPIRTMEYTDVQQLEDGRFYPTSWTVIPQEPEKAGHETVVKITETVFDKEVDPAYFTKRALKRFSK
ncbi:MAG: outer membrane lipoprotein-sorting protein [Candidatus Electrothrix aestuarii]|uniref:Outer membrane lipoprotein-sorting protein n=1 Tax=Candidatus Electrothrix aestuarii TaxID=3062594 RepID=A0AAU8LUN9_9BACT|nr:outer membrane lipoprotein-sorting protein [Candidatus Electrothrix aestuarii]